MRCLHISDTHGYNFNLPNAEFDIIVHSGDLCKDNNYHKLPIDPDHLFQLRSINDNIKKIKSSN